MSRLAIAVGAAVLLAAGSAGAVSAPEAAAVAALKDQIHRDPMAAPALKDFAEKNLLAQCTNPVLVREARRQNSRKVTLPEIQAIDKEWMATASTTPFKVLVLDNAASKEIKKVSEGLKAVKEAFLMDGQGALVGATNLTADYWQGDEKKWTESYREGKGAAYIAPAEFESSVGAVLQQISLPLLDSAGKPVGAVTWGILLDKIDWQGGKK